MAIIADRDYCCVKYNIYITIYNYSILFLLQIFTLWHWLTKVSLLRIVIFVVKIIGHAMIKVFSTKLYYLDLYLLLTIKIV